MAAETDNPSYGYCCARPADDFFWDHNSISDGSRMSNSSPTAPCSSDSVFWHHKKPGEALHHEAV